MKVPSFTVWFLITGMLGGFGTSEALNKGQNVSVVLILVLTVVALCTAWRGYVAWRHWWERQTMR